MPTVANLARLLAAKDAEIERLRARLEEAIDWIKGGPDLDHSGGKNKLAELERALTDSSTERRER